MPASRRDFLARAGLGAITLASLPTVASAAASTGPARDDGEASRARADLAAYLALEADAAGDQPPAQAWDTSWTARVTGRHRAMFDIPELEGGVGVFRAGIWGRQVADVLKAAPGEVCTVIVIRHNAMPYLMTHEFWTAYEVGKALRIKDERGRTQRTNPVLTAPDAAPGSGSPFALDRLIANGAIVLGCNLAFRAIVSLVEKRDKLPAAEARAKALAAVIPGAIMQPSGIFANVLAQEAGCHFVRGV